MGGLKADPSLLQAHARTAAASAAHVGPKGRVRPGTVRIRRPACFRQLPASPGAGASLWTAAGRRPAERPEGRQSSRCHAALPRGLAYPRALRAACVPDWQLHCTALT